MPTINQLTAVDSVTATDLVPIYSSTNGDARKASMSVLQDYILANAEFINATLVTPDIGTPTAGNLTNCIGLTIPGGGTGANTADDALTNFGGTTIGKAVFKAATAADGRTALLAAASGDNSDITSLTGLTTPVTVAQGGTGLASPGALNNVLTSNGAGAWVSSAFAGGGMTTDFSNAIAANPVATGGTGQTTIAGARNAIGTGVAVIKTTNYTAVAGDVLACDTTGGAFNITLPLSPTAGDKPIVIFDAGTTASLNGFATNNLTVLRNGSSIHNGADDVFFATKGICVTFEFVAGTWRLEIGR